jgi:hypothetical protein
MVIAPVALAEDGLPPGVPVPAWAVGKHVHFFPAPRRRAEVLASEESQQELSPQLSPAVVGTPFCYGKDKLCYWGGPIQHEPQLYVIFWGEAFEQGPPATQELTTLRDFYLGLEENKGEPGEKSWQGIISQYFDNEGPGSIKAKVKVIFNKPTIPGEINNEQVETVISELVQSEREKGVEPSPEAQYIVLPQPGTKYGKYTQMKEACGFHAVDDEGYSYTVVPWAEDVECENEEGAVAETNGAASHEFAESATDPSIEEPGKNYTSNIGWTKEAKGEVEVADLCEEEPHEFEKPKNDFWWAAKLWDDQGGNKCAIEDPPYPAPAAPSATTGAASNLETTKATLEGSVNPNGPDTHYYFQYGTTTSYGQDSPTPPGNDAGFGETAVPASTALTGLKPGTLYHYRIVASSWVGTTDGTDQTFRTPGWIIQTTQNPVGALHDDFLHGVSCSSATACTAVGEYTSTEEKEATLVERWNGTTWEVQTSPNPTGATGSFLESVSCPSSTACTATGYKEEKGGLHATLAERWNGSSWEVQTTPTSGNSDALGSVSCVSASECTAVGFVVSGNPAKKTPVVENWNGKTWTVVSSAKLPTEDEQSWFESVSCPAAKSCTAVGSYISSKLGEQSLAEHWNGSTWSVQTTPELADDDFEIHLDGVSCSATSACTAVGNYEKSRVREVLVERWNGTSWQVQKTPNPTGKSEGAEGELTQVSCPSATSCVAIGADDSGSGKPGLLLGEYWNGTSWELEFPTNRTGVEYNILGGVSCSAATKCTSVGYSRKPTSYETLAERLELP